MNLGIVYEIVFYAMNSTIDQNDDFLYHLQLVNCNINASSL